MHFSRPLSPSVPLLNLSLALFPTFLEAYRAVTLLVVVTETSNVVTVSHHVLPSVSH